MIATKIGDRSAVQQNTYIFAHCCFKRKLCPVHVAEASTVQAPIANSQSDSP